MSQGEILEVLEKAKKPMSSKAISKITGKCQSSTSRCLKKLVEQEDIKITFNHYTKRDQGFLYWCHS